MVLSQVVHGTRLVRSTNYFSVASTFPSHGLSIKPALQNPNLGRIQCGVYSQVDEHFWGERLHPAD